MLVYCMHHDYYHYHYHYHYHHYHHYYHYYHYHYCIAGIGATFSFLHQHPEFGLSSYDSHKDGSGVAYVSTLRPQLMMRPVRKTSFLRHLYLKTIILPRQARDKHRKNSKKGRFSQAGSGVAKAGSSCTTRIVTRRTGSRRARATRCSDLSVRQRRFTTRSGTRSPRCRGAMSI